MKASWGLVVVLAGCPAATPTSSTTPAPAATPKSADSDATPPASAAPAAATPAPATPVPATSAAEADGRVVMPDLTGKTQAEAQAALRAAGIASELEANTAVLECEHAAHDEGKVNCQNPEPGARVDRRGIVRVNVFHGAHGHFGVLTRDQTSQLIGMTLGQAKKKLAALGFHGQIDVNESKDVADTCKYDTVCEVLPEDFQLDAPITLRVNKAKLEIRQPD